ncbi:kinase [Thraustotheca clavata]|uniref:Kinase n=1 Tax=Thraustotheca clavata TaxID=74557 RepID=A0A1V9ZNP3_9STRA|nr:kinase [Thraustotheca clavata]
MSTSGEYSTITKSTNASTGAIAGVAAIIVAVVFYFKKRRQVEIDNNNDLNMSGIRPHRLEYSELSVTSKAALAAGAFGEVWLGSYRSQPVAIKRLKSRDPKQVQMFINEITLMATLESDYIVKFIGVSWTRPIEVVCIVEFMNLGDLRGYLATHSPDQYTWDQKHKCIVSIVEGLIYLHTCTPPIIHRDLKSRNILLDNVKGTKLTDFGISKAVEDDENSLTSGIGTYQWMAPEVIASTKYSSAADVYSFGIVLSEFCTHQVPYSAMGPNGTSLSYLQVLKRVGEGKLTPSFGESSPAWVKEMAIQCLQLDPISRPSALQLSETLRHLNDH